MARSTVLLVSVLLVLSLFVQSFLAVSFIKSYPLAASGMTLLGLTADEFTGDVYLSTTTNDFRLLRFNSDLCLLRSGLVDSVGAYDSMNGGLAINSNMHPAVLVPLYFYHPFSYPRSTVKLVYRNATLNPLEPNDCYSAIDVNTFPNAANIVVNMNTNMVYYSINELLNVLPSTQPADCAPPLVLSQFDNIACMASDDDRNLLFFAINSQIYVMDQTTLSILTSFPVTDAPSHMQANPVTQQLHVLLQTSFYIVIDYSNLAAMSIISTQAFEFLSLINLTLDLALNRAYVLADMTFPAQAQVIVQFTNNFYDSVSLLANVQSAQLITFNPNSKCLYLTGNDLENSLAQSIFKFC